MGRGLIIDPKRLEWCFPYLCKQSKLKAVSRPNGLGIPWGGGPEKGHEYGVFAYVL